jgi:hypothetical protein
MVSKNKGGVILNMDYRHYDKLRKKILRHLNNDKCYNYSITSEFNSDENNNPIEKITYSITSLKADSKKLKGGFSKMKTNKTEVETKQVATKRPEEIKLFIPRSRLVEKTIKGSKGDFTVLGVNVGSKYVRLYHKKEHTLPNTILEGVLWARSFKYNGKDLTELAIFITNSLEPIQDEALDDNDQDDLPF